MKRNCDNCQKEYDAPPYNLRRGWGLCCSQNCAAKRREELKKDPNKYFQGRTVYKVKMVLSDGSERWAMSRNHVAALTFDQANVFYQFIRKYGFGTNRSNDLIFGEIFYLKQFKYTNIRRVIAVYLTEIN